MHAHMHFTPTIQEYYSKQSAAGYWNAAHTATCYAEVSYVGGSVKHSNIRIQIVQNNIPEWLDPVASLAVILTCVAYCSRLTNAARVHLRMDYYALLKGFERTYTYVLPSLFIYFCYV